MIEVKYARYAGGYRLEIAFNTGETGVVDLGDSLWGPVFEPLRNPDSFARFSLSSALHTVVWENEADFAPEYLRDRMVEQVAVNGCPGRC